MPSLIECPNCSGFNKPGAERCHACGRKLSEAAGAKATASSVVLKRVTSGEVFTAIMSDSGKRRSSSRSSSPSVLVQVDAPEEPNLEDNSDVLAEAVHRIRTAAQAEGHRFKPYVRSKNRKPPNAQGKEEVAEHLDVAVMLLRDRRFEEAVEPLLKAIARDDENRRPWILLGEAYLRIERPYKAAVAYLRSLELSPKDEQAWVGLARVLRSINELNAAAMVLDRAVLLHPDRADTWSERGLVLEALQNLPEAMASFAKALALRPDHRVALPKLRELGARFSQADGQTVESEATDPETDVTIEPAAPAEAEIEDDILDEMDEPLVPEAPPEAGPPKADTESLAVVPPAASNRPPRVPTFVEGLDDALEGGIPWGHVVLIAGAPGTMKSSLGFSILLDNAAREGLHCLYLSLEERASSLLKQMGSLGLKLEVPKGSLVVLDPRTASDLLGEKADWIAALQEGVRSIKEQRGLDLIVIDSLEALEVLAKFKDRRREMYRLFEWLRDLDMTSIVITERPDWLIGGHVLQGRWDEDFLADGVLHLRIHMVSDLEAQRRLRVVKMRGTKHETGYLAMVLDDGRFRVTRAMST